MRLIVVVGARPNFIKVAPLVPTLEAAGHDVGLAHTGQHYDAVMSDIFFSDLQIPEPRWYLNVGSGTHAVQTGTAMMRLEELFMAEKPDGVIVVGDVNSTLSNDLGFGGSESPDQGAATPVWLATEPIGQQRTGRYFERQQESACRFCGDASAVQALYERCAAY